MTSNPVQGPRMLSRTDLQQLAFMRLDDTKALYAQGRFNGALYMGGYVVEMALKARICKVLDAEYPIGGDYRVYKTHSYDTLLFLGGLRNTFNREKHQNTGFAANWSIATKWNESFRYEMSTATDQEVSDLLIALEDQNDGIFNWIQKLW